MAKKIFKKRHFLVKGVDKNYRDFGGFKYPRIGPVASKAWDEINAYLFGIIGIDYESYQYNIHRKNFLIIEYNPGEGLVRFGKEKIKIRKGNVVYSSPDISKIQEWLEANGGRYRGFGANLTVGDNEKIGVGDVSQIKTGNNCIIEAGHYCTIITGDNCTITSKFGGDIKTGINSWVNGGVYSTVSCGVGSAIRWGIDKYESQEFKINEEYSGKIFDGEVCGRFFNLKELDDQGKIIKYIYNRKAIKCKKT